MLFPHLRILWRAFSRQPLYAILNVFCLGLGIATALLILLYMQFELTFDQYHERADQIYRIETRKIHTRERVMDVEWRGVPGNIAPLAQQDFPEVAAIMRAYYFFYSGEVILEIDEKEIQTDQIYNVDASIFDLFSLNLIHGAPEQALSAPNSILLSESLAERLFGGKDPVGQILTSNTPTGSSEIEELQLQITGVYEDWPANSHWTPNALISSATDPDLKDAYFNRFGFSTYVRLAQGVEPDTFAAKLSQIYLTYLDPVREPVLIKAEHHLIPLLEVHFEETEGQIYLYIFGAIGILLLMIAIISYVNLSIAQTTKRAKEVGLKKVLGANRRQLIFQFLGESLLYTFLSLLLALLLVIMGVEYINSWLSLSLDASQLWEPELLLSMFCLWTILGLLGGSYPALFLASLQVVDVWKGKIGRLGRRTILRNALVIFQFGTVLFVLISTGMIYLQLNHLRNKDLGFDQAQVLAIGTPQISHQELNRLKYELNQIPEVQAYCPTSFLPGAGNMIRGPISVETPKGPQQEFVRRGQVDELFLPTMDIQLVEGRNFSSEFPSDSTKSVIINQTFVRTFGLTDPIGTNIRLGGQDNPNAMQVIGVIEDYHESSLHSPIRAQLYLYVNHRISIMMVKLAGNLPEGIQAIEQTWQTVFPGQQFDHEFLNEFLQEAYEADRLRGRIFQAFSGITLVIAFLGLFGLASFLFNQRIKEIGIRKILGAETSQLVFLAIRPFFVLLAIAMLPASLLAWRLLDNWLETFAFRIGMNLGVFAGVFLLVLVLITAIVGIHAVRTARRNPVEALRNE